MPELAPSSALNDLLVRLNRSLLQYAGESWPWTDLEAAGEQAVVDSLVQRQRTHVGRLAELLWGRYWNIDFGVYPAEYTDLHYVALDYLLTLLVASENDVLGEIERVLPLCAGDEDAARIVEDARNDQREIVEQLQRLVETRNAAAGNAA